MKYKPTPLNIVSGAVIGFSIYAGLNPGPMGFGLLGLFFFLPVGLIALAVDFVIQLYSKKYLWVVTVEGLIIFVLAFGYGFTQRTKTLIIPDERSFDYIVTIYEVENAPELPVNFLSWNYKTEVPANGILLTSTSLKSDLPQTKMFTKAGVNLQNRNDSVDIGFGHVQTASIDCSNRTYNYQAWKIDQGGTITYSSRELDSLQLSLQELICKEKPSR